MRTRLWLLVYVRNTLAVSDATRGLTTVGGIGGKGACAGALSVALPASPETWHPARRLAFVGMHAGAGA